MGNEHNSEHEHPDGNTNLIFIIRDPFLRMLKSDVQTCSKTLYSGQTLRQNTFVFSENFGI
jgi:hypothetical protein